MHTSMRRVLIAGAALGLILCALALPGCTQRALWGEQNSSADPLRFWGGDSAVATHQARQNTTQMGFGVTQGPAEQ